MDEDNKIRIVETLWRIILSDGKSDIYEDNLMRRLAGLLYLDDKVVGETKLKVLNKHTLIHIIRYLISHISK